MQRTLAIGLTAFMWPVGVLGGQLTLAEREQATFRDAVATVAPSVVQIRCLGGLDEVDDVMVAPGPTTGLVISDEGYILTSAFAFAQQPSSILVTTPDGRQAPAELIATDHSRKLVLLKTEGLDGLAVTKFVPAEEIRVGMWAIALGKAFDAERASTAVGIVSARNRMFGRVVQTDAAVSPANYGGPLIDIEGRVIGLMVPIAPQKSSDMAGFEWYDSGIGFAVPLATLEQALERMKKGEDLYAGRLGISFARGNPHETPAEIGSTRAQGPAAVADLKKGDRIVAVDNEPVESQTDLRFRLGPRYAGERVSLTVVRGEERFERSLELAGKFAPLRHGFLGILPRRAAQRDEVAETDENDGQQSDGDAPRRGVVIRALFDDGPAKAAGVVPGDVLLTINDTDLSSIDDGLVTMSSVSVGERVRITIASDDGQEQELEVVAGPASTDLPPARPAPDTDDAAVATDQMRELKLAGFPNECKLYMPQVEDTDFRPGVLFWLHAPGRANVDALLSTWRLLCERYKFVLVAPMSADPARWERSEREYLERLVARVLGDYDVDPNRVAVHGQQGGGGMAYLVGLSLRDQVRGISVAAAPLPRLVAPPETSSSNRLLIRSAQADDDPAMRRIRLGLRKLGQAGYSVLEFDLSSSRGELTREDREALARWFDALDRL